MKKVFYVSAVIMVLSVLIFTITGCKDGGLTTATKETAQEEVETAEEVIEEAESSEEEVTEEASDEEFKVGFVLLGTITDGGWTQAHYDGLEYVEETIPGVECIYVENVPESSDCERVMTEFAQQGCKVIIACSFGYMDYVINVAENFPDVVFLHAGGYKTRDNVGTYFGHNEQTRYLSGLLAGKMTEANKIGYVAAHPIPEVIRGINAFTVGVREVNPEAVVKVVWTNTWFDPAAEKEAATSLIDAGCDIMAQHQDSPGPQQAAEEAGIYSIGYDSDMSKYAPNAVMTSLVWHWGVYYAKAVEEVKNGTWKTEQYWGDISEGIVDLAPFGDMVPDDVVGFVNEAKDGLIAHEYNVFDGPIKDQDGEIRVPDGETLSDEDNLGFNWFVEGVEGKIPE